MVTGSTAILLGTMAGGKACAAGGKTSCKTMEASLPTPSLLLMVRDVHTGKDGKGDHREDSSALEKQKSCSYVECLE